MTGWITDFIRFWWALFYWNARKGWFRLRGAQRDDCPCQNASDSGLGGDTRCDAIVHWHQPERFRRVCPFLVNTAEGLRCSVEAESVRPFWGRVALYGLALGATVYLGATALVYGVLRLSNYELNYATVALPTRWPELRLAQEKFYADRAETALASSNVPRAIEALEQVCRINPQNYPAGLTLARLARFSGQPGVSEHVYRRLMSDLPEHRVQTARVWLPVLLANGNYADITPLAANMIGEDPAQRAQWLHALLFSARQRDKPALLVEVLQQNPHFPEWCTRLINLEIDLLQKHFERARPGLNQALKPLPSDYAAAFQVHHLLQQSRPDDALALLSVYGSKLSRAEATLLRLEIYRTNGMTAQAELASASLLNSALTDDVVAKFSAHLLVHPSTESSRLLYRTVTERGPVLNHDSLPLYNSLYLAAVVAGEKPSSDLLRSQLRSFAVHEGRALDRLAQLLAERKSGLQIARLLPLVTLPNEMTYRILQQGVAP